MLEEPPDEDSPGCTTKRELGDAGFVPSSASSSVLRIAKPSSGSHSTCSATKSFRSLAAEILGVEGFLVHITVKDVQFLSPRRAFVSGPEAQRAYPWTE